MQSTPVAKSRDRCTRPRAKFLRANSHVGDVETVSNGRFRFVIGANYEIFRFEIDFLRVLWLFNGVCAIRPFAVVMRARRGCESHCLTAVCN